jgi:hypothetical protein
MKFYVCTISDNTIKRSFKCANKLLSEGKISYVFFAADSAKLRKMARSYISSPEHLVEIPAELQFSTAEKDTKGDNFDIRDADGMHAAVLEWFFIGEADYCMSTSIFHSTFSKTAVVRGKCKYISYFAAENCDVDSTGHTKFVPVDDKEPIMLSDSLTNEPAFKVPKVDRNTVWDSIKMYRGISREQCTWHSATDVDYDAVSKFWRDGSRLGHAAAATNDNS